MTTEANDGRMASDVKLEDILNQEMKATGADIKPGSYAATLVKFGAPFKIKQSEKFRKEGQPDTRTVFEAIFAVFDASGDPQIVKYLLGVVDNGMANRKSNLYKMLRSIGGTKGLVDAEGNFKKGTKLVDFYGCGGVLSISNNEEGWPKVDSIGQPMAGQKAPTVEQGEAALKAQSSDGVPF